MRITELRSKSWSRKTKVTSIQDHRQLITIKGHQIITNQVLQIRN